jgi:hypothetical protein
VRIGGTTNDGRCHHTGRSHRKFQYPDSPTRGEPYSTAAAAKINSANSPKIADERTIRDTKATLAAVAKQYGLAPDELDQAIRAAISEKAVGPDHPSTAECLNNLTAVQINGRLN